jgi:hypothetical protein
VESQFSALAYQFPQLHNVGIGAYYRQYPESSMTEMIVTSNGMITTGKTYRFNQYSFAFGTGITLYSTEHFAHCIGTGLMVYTENEIDSYFRSSHSKFDINVGYLVCFAKRLQFGLQMVFNDYLKSGFKNDNSAYGSEPGFIAISTGLGYKDVFRSGDNDLLRVAAEISYSNYGPPLKFGAEAQLFNSCAFRIGEQGDIFSIGTGIALFNHFECNFYWPSNNEDTYYPKSLGFSIRFCRILAWSKDDWQWWKHKE